MINFRPLTDEEVEREAEARFVNAMEILESLDDETIPDELLQSLITTTHEYDWEGLVITEHYQAYEDYKYG
jgi:hypothetical protein